MGRGATGVIRLGGKVLQSRLSQSHILSVGIKNPVGIYVQILPWDLPGSTVHVTFTRETKKKGGRKSRRGGNEEIY